MTAPDVYVIQKQTAIERYTRRTLNVDFMEYLSHDPHDLKHLTEAHDAHARAREALLTSLGKAGLRFSLMNLDELMEGEYSYFDPDDSSSGMNPSAKLIISLGGDGTLLHASHYCGGATTLLGINSNSASSVGHLCALLPNEVERAVEGFFAGKLPCGRVRRLKCEPSNSSRLPLALNDVLLCNRHPAATSRYQISVRSADSAGNSQLESEKQQSSGVWIAAPAGSTAAISSHGLPPQALSAATILFAVREYYNSSDDSPERGASPRFLKGVLDGNCAEMTLSCRMRQGMVCIDGPDSSLLMGFGDSVAISLPESATLSLAVPKPRKTGADIFKAGGKK